MLRSQIKLTSYEFSDLHITGKFDNRPGTGRASADLLSDYWKFLALVRHRTMPGRAPFKSYDINIKQKSSGARPMCANAGRAPSRHRTVPGRCDFTLNDPTKRRTGAVEFRSTWNSPSTLRCLKNWSKIVRFSLPPAGHRTDAVESYDVWLNIRRTVHVDDLWP